MSKCGGNLPNSDSTAKLVADLCTLSIDLQNYILPRLSQSFTYNFVFIDKVTWIKNFITLAHQSKVLNVGQKLSNLVYQTIIKKLTRKGGGKCLLSCHWQFFTSDKLAICVTNVSVFWACLYLLHWKGGCVGSKRVNVPGIC